MEQGKTALLTGGTDGIGLELAKLFAQDKHSLILVARHDDRLQQVAEELKQLGAPAVECLAIDLSQPHSAQQVFEAVQGRQIDFLVNNAGQGQRGMFAEYEIERDYEIITLNILSLVHLTKLFLPQMLQRNSGRILNLSSIAAFQPTPLLAVYSATKAFVQHFTDALINEIKDSDVTVTALLPTATDTDFFNKADAEGTRAHEMATSAAEAAKSGYDAMMKGQHRAMANFKAGMEKTISNFLPNEWVAAMGRYYMGKAEEGDKKDEGQKDQAA